MIHLVGPWGLAPAEQSPTRPCCARVTEPHGPPGKSMQHRHRGDVVQPHSRSRTATLRLLQMTWGGCRVGQAVA
jgi:hypothetical protein